MQQQEQKLIADIKKASKVLRAAHRWHSTPEMLTPNLAPTPHFPADPWQDGNMTVANALAKELIRVRQTTVRLPFLPLYFAENLGSANIFPSMSSQHAPTKPRASTLNMMGLPSYVHYLVGWVGM